MPEIRFEAGDQDVAVLDCQSDHIGGLPEMTSIAIGLAAVAYIAAIVAALRLFKHTDGDDESV